MPDAFRPSALNLSAAAAFATRSLGAPTPEPVISGPLIPRHRQAQPPPGRAPRIFAPRTPRWASACAAISNQGAE